MKLNKKPSALRFAFSACLFYNKQNLYCWTISFGKRELGTESTYIEHSEAEIDHFYRLEVGFFYRYTVNNFYQFLPINK